MEKARIGVVGCGKISGIYLQAPRRLPMIEIVACCDLDRGAAEARAAEFGVSRVLTLEEMLANPEIDIILNLTHPAGHAEIALAALAAGKSVYNEKPLAVTREEGRQVLDAAGQSGLRVGCAPDTFLGAGLQTCRKLIEDGAIGDPVGATAFMMCPGHESWHPNPDFYYQPGAGPMFDMGPYYLTALIHLIGPIVRVSSATRVTYPQRTITSEPRKGEIIQVNTPTHIAGLMDFANGAIGTIITSFDVWGAQLPRIEIYGTKGSLSLPDPNTFGGPISLKRGREKEWQPIELTHGYAENTRGLGVADMACAIAEGRPHRASAEMAFHVLDVMHAFLESSEQDRHVRIVSTCRRPAPLPAGVNEGTVAGLAAQTEDLHSGSR
jgi:predicted dehydrogenase